MTTKTVKRFNTLSVAGAISGIVLEEKGFGGIADVFDHLFPGIYTMGIAAMAPHAADELSRQHPKLAESLSKYSRDDLKERTRSVAIDLLEEFGQSLDVEGPLDVSQAEIDDAFETLRSES